MIRDVRPRLGPAGTVINKTCGVSLDRCSRTYLFVLCYLLVVTPAIGGLLRSVRGALLLGRGLPLSAQVSELIASTVSVIV